LWRKKVLGKTTDPQGTQQAQHTARHAYTTAIVQLGSRPGG